MNPTHRALFAIVLLVLVLLGVNVFADAALRNARLDLTENRLYTLSDGTRSILRKVDEPITLTLYYSESVARGRPSIQNYGKRVREILEEYRRLSAGKIKLHVRDPEPFSEAEEQAQREGLRAVPISASERLFLGLVATNALDGRETIPFFDPGDERFLEYELSRLIYKLSNLERATVGVLSSLPLDGAPAMPQVPGMPPEPSTPWQIMRELRSLFDVELLDPAADAIPDSIDLLLIIHPKDVDARTLRAIDAYIIRGGPAVICVDPLCEADIPPGAAQNPMLLVNADRASNLPTLFDAWGVSFTHNRIVADRASAMRGRTPDGTGVISYLQYLGLTSERFNADDPITRGLSRLQIATVGAFTHNPGAATTLTPLVSSSPENMLIDAMRFALFADPREIISGFLSADQPRTIAARLSGPARTAFDAEPAEGSINVILISDADFLADRWWINELRLGGQLFGYQKVSDNADLLISAIDNLAGASDLVTIRARGAFARPFTLVQEIQRQAEQVHLSRAQSLEEERRETERRLAELQRARPDAGEVILTAEQEAELRRFRAQLADTNARLREVRYNLRKDVERLGLTLRIINTAAAPLLVALAALALAAVRHARRARDRNPRPAA